MLPKVAGQLPDFVIALDVNVVLQIAIIGNLLSYDRSSLFSGPVIDFAVR